MAEATGTQAIDRAAQLLVRVVESARAPSIGELAERAGCRRARPRGSSPRSSARASCSGSATAAGSGPGRCCSATPAATAPGRSSSSRGRRCAGSPRRAARRSTSPSPGRTGSSTSRRRTPSTSSASPTGSGGACRSSSRPTASASSPTAAPASAELQQIRARGYATSVDELEVGLSALAAPVFGPGGDALAALSISGPTTRLTSERIAQLAPLLMEEATRLAERLGHRDHARGAA